MQVCVIIPTKHRPDDLQRAVRSLFAQTVAPLSLIIVDQSTDDESYRRVEAELAAAARNRGASWKLNYILEPQISGAAMARNRAIAVAHGDVWLFLDDDVILESDFVEQLLAVYRDRPCVGGVSGVICNYPRPPVMSRIWNSIFARGPFRDERQPIYWNANRLRNSPPITVRRFGAGLMSFRADAVRGKFFDENLHGVSEGEDVDFCSRLDPGTTLLIAPRARLQHNHSLVGRLRDHWLRRSARGNVFLYRKNWHRGLVNRLCYAWLWVGYCLVATVASLRRRSLDPCRALRNGTREATQAVLGTHLNGVSCELASAHRDLGCRPPRRS